VPEPRPTSLAAPVLKNSWSNHGRPAQLLGRGTVASFKTYERHFRGVYIYIYMYIWNGESLVLSPLRIDLLNGRKNLNLLEVTLKNNAEKKRAHRG